MSEHFVNKLEPEASKAPSLRELSAARLTEGVSNCAVTPSVTASGGATSLQEGGFVYKGFTHSNTLGAEIYSEVP